MNLEFKLLSFVLRMLLFNDQIGKIVKLLRNLLHGNAIRFIHKILCVHYVRWLGRLVKEADSYARDPSLRLARPLFGVETLLLRF